MILWVPNEHVADNLKSELYELPTRNVVVDQLKRELTYLLKFFVSKLEDVREDGGELQASVAGDDESIEVTEQVVSQEQLAESIGLCRSLLKRTLHNEVNGLQILNTVRSLRYATFTDADGNSPFTMTTNMIRFEAVYLSNTPEQVLVSKLRCTITKTPCLCSNPIVPHT